MEPLERTRQYDERLTTYLSMQSIVQPEKSATTAVRIGVKTSKIQNFCRIYCSTSKKIWKFAVRNVVNLENV